MSDIPYIRRELRENIPDQKITVTKRGKHGFNLRLDERKVKPSLVKRIVERWFRCAHGVTVNWGKPKRD